MVVHLRVELLTDLGTWRAWFRGVRGAAGEESRVFTSKCRTTRDGCFGACTIIHVCQTTTGVGCRY